MAIGGVDGCLDTAIQQKGGHKSRTGNQENNQGTDLSLQFRVGTTPNTFHLRLRLVTIVGPFPQKAESNQIRWIIRLGKQSWHARRQTGKGSKAIGKRSQEALDYGFAPLVSHLEEKVDGQECAHRESPSDRGGKHKASRRTRLRVATGPRSSTRHPLGQHEGMDNVVHAQYYVPH